MYVPTSDKKYINIEKECKLTIYTDNQNSNIDYKIFIGIYSLDELDSILNGVENKHLIELTINDINELNIRYYKI